MRIRKLATAALLMAAAACAAPQDEGEAPAAAALGQPVATAQATPGKPLIHVWKSPT